MQQMNSPKPLKARLTADEVRIGRLSVLACAIAALSACGEEASEDSQTAEPACIHASGTVPIEAGKYPVGSNLAYPEEGPSQTVQVSDFWISRTEVTVGQFAKFVEATGYTTVAERPVDPETLDGMALSEEQRAHFLSPGGAVFDPSRSSSAGDHNWWIYTPGANWQVPEGPGQRTAKTNEPVTQIALEDARAYAKWTGGRLPTENEWEVAASFGSSGDNSKTTAPENANTWQGVFPVVNQESDGFAGVSPVGCFPPNEAGLYDVIGNVWEWTDDTYRPNRSAVGSDDEREAQSAGSNALQGTIKGGSFLCAPNYCMRYRPSARQAQEAGLGTNHIGFRIVYDSNPATAQ